MIPSQNTPYRRMMLAMVALAGVPASLLGSGQPAAKSGHAPTASRPSAAARDPARIVRIAVVQAGQNHYAKGNPGAEANFKVLEAQAREAATATPKPDVIVFPEFSLSGWPYMSEGKINSLAEKVPGDGPWYRRYRDLARSTG